MILLRLLGQKRMQNVSSYDARIHHGVVHGSFLLVVVFQQFLPFQGFLAQTHFPIHITSNRVHHF